MDHVPSDKTDLEISEINRSNLTWKANVCMLQKTHPDYDAIKCEGAHGPLSLAQISSESQVFNSQSLHAETKAMTF